MQTAKKENIVSRILTAVAFMWVLTGFFACGSNQEKSETPPDYVAQIEQWHKDRIDRLLKPDGWLSLAGLYWLKEGENSFGSDSSNDIVFPAGKAPASIGSFLLRGGKVTVKIKPGVKVLSAGRPVRKLALQDDWDGHPTQLNYGTLMWYIHKVDDKYAVRLKDTENPARINFKGIERYPIDAKWRIKAKFEPYDPPKHIPIPNIKGFNTDEISPGRLVFKVKGKTYTLDPIFEVGEKDYFIIFGDKTNGIETYGAGRFVYASPPDSEGYTYIDFNKAYNPPCVFTNYATCPLPPPQNRLPFKVTAGEKKYAGTHH